MALSFVYPSLRRDEGNQRLSRRTTGAVPPPQARWKSWAPPSRPGDWPTAGTVNRTLTGSTAEELARLALTWAADEFGASLAVLSSMGDEVLDSSGERCSSPESTSSSSTPDYHSPDPLGTRAAFAAPDR